MSNERTPIEELRFYNSPNLGRALKREEAEANRVLTAEEKDEVAQLDELIQLAMKACRKGSTVRGKRNPAFANLSSLVKTRQQILDGKRPKKNKSVEELLRQAEALRSGGAN